ncbi:MAG: NTP transferase domain-containing protein [Oscillospiraceae bacterium]|nr:NTP transferase domain-containing protein [Oscillospiraceae bacterium]
MLKSIILAAGKGTRMQTEGVELPKVMRTALGKPLLGYVLDALPTKGRDNIVVVGFMREKVEAAFTDCSFAVQAEQKGTGHAVMCAFETLGDFDGDVLICCGDAPLVRPETFAALVEEHRAKGNDCTVLSGASEVPLRGYGRVIRDEHGGFVKIVEEKDASPEEFAVQEYNSGVYVFSAPKLRTALTGLRTNNAQGEYYLTDAPDIMLTRGDKVGVCVREMGDELIGVNTPAQLAEVERLLQERK